MDFTSLGEWCLERQGQLIVCENEGADWLQFQPLTVFRGSTKTQIEVMYTQER